MSIMFNRRSLIAIVLASSALAGGNAFAQDQATVGIQTTTHYYPDTPLQARIDSIGWGIAQQNGSTGCEQLPAVKPTFEWIRLAQRIPVMVRIEKVPDNIKLRAGTTASVVVITGTGTDSGQVPPVPRALQ
jgi:multidrug resistance efflux pump